MKKTHFLSRLRLRPGDGRLIVTGALAGAVNGLMGAGGGTVLVLLLTGWCGRSEQEACATSVAVIAPFCTVSAIWMLAAGSAPAEGILVYCVGGLVGGLIGGRLLGRIPAHWLMRLFGGLMILAGLRAMF